MPSASNYWRWGVNRPAAGAAAQLPWFGLGCRGHHGRPVFWYRIMFEASPPIFHAAWRQRVTVHFPSVVTGDLFGRLGTEAIFDIARRPGCFGFAPLPLGDAIA